METEYAVELVEYGGIMLVYQKINGTLTKVAQVPISYAIDKAVAFAIREQVVQCQPFMKAEDRAFFKIPEDFGQVLIMHCKVWDMLPSLYEKLLYVDRTQIFSLVSGQQFKELRDRLNVYYMVKKVEGKQEGE